MGSVRDMAHSADDINHEARKRVEEWSQRPAAPDYMDTHTKKVNSFVSAMVCLGLACLLVGTWVLFI